MIHRADPECRRDIVIWWYAGNAILLTLLILVPVWVKTALHLFHNYDLGIFAQALNSIAIDDINPFLPAINRRIFSDHFDPILILVAPLGHLIEPAYAALLFEHVLVLLTPLPLFYLFDTRDAKNAPFACFAITYLLFNRGIASALCFPAHPTTWASFFVVIIVVLLVKKKGPLWLIITSILLMSCKEEFPFVVLMIGVYLLWCRTIKSGISLVALATVWIIIAYGIRPWWLGDTKNYASVIISPIIEAPFQTIWDRLAGIGDAKRFIRCILPLFPVVYWFARRGIPYNWVMLFSAMPLIAIRFIAKAWSFHYLAPVAPLLLFFTLPRGENRLPWHYSIICIILTVLSSSGPITRSLEVYGKISEFGGQRIESIEYARSHLLEQNHGNAMVEGNLTPLLACRNNVFQIAGDQPPDVEYRFFLTEKPPRGDPYPLKHHDIDKLIEVWRSKPDINILKEDDYIFFAEKKIY